MKIVLSAYACEPGRGSEPGVGWNLARALAERHDVWVVTRSNNRYTIEAEMTNSPMPRLHFVYYDLPGWARFWKRGQKGVHVYYYLWQAGIYPLVRRLIRDIGADLVHHVTFVKYWAPSFLALLPVPFVWGPVGGGESMPRSFWRDAGLRGFALEAARELSRWLAERDPFVRLTARKSLVALATTEETAVRLRRMGARDVLVFSQVGLSEGEIQYLGDLAMPPNPPLVFLSMGRLLPWKGFHLGIRAFALAGIDDAEYWIVGDGPDRTRLERLTRSLGVWGRVRFWGAKPRHEALRLLGDSHVLIHPSLHDSGGWVCVEAMAARRPVVCLDLGGPGTQVDERTGLKVPAHDPAQAVAGLADALMRLAHDGDLLARLGDGGHQRVREVFTWGADRAKAIEAHYRGKGSGS